MSWQVELIADDQTEWVSNLLRFVTEEEAIRYGQDLASQWVLVKKWRVTESSKPANSRWDYRGLHALP